MLLISGKKILEEINLKLDETLKEINDNSCDLISEKDRLLGSYEEQIVFQKQQLEQLQKMIEHSDEKYRKLFAKTGGLARGNNKLQQDKIRLKEDIKSLKKTLLSQEKTIENFKIDVIEKEKLKAIIEQQEKIISEKIKRKPTKEEIINYDKKNPMMK